ncbi:hypothetical protein PR048_017552 [Dryococelus australis]|uniref:Uncharacterized protein n=1 Tax=Dryococelus australis TaxID=614101 RepID=A0ABQ9H9W8_9NEOP|nr:hypothetical protein PR048_017552 [Dryococelus australis]
MYVSRWYGHVKRMGSERLTEEKGHKENHRREGRRKTAVVQWLATWTNQILFSSGSLQDFRMWESSWTIPLSADFLRDLPFSPPFNSDAALYSPCITPIGSQNLDPRKQLPTELSPYFNARRLNAVINESQASLVCSPYTWLDAPAESSQSRERPLPALKVRWKRPSTELTSWSEGKIPVCGLPHSVYRIFVGSKLCLGSIEYSYAEASVSKSLRHRLVSSGSSSGGRLETGRQSNFNSPFTLCWAAASRFIGWHLVDEGLPLSGGDESIASLACDITGWLREWKTNDETRRVATVLKNEFSVAELPGIAVLPAVPVARGATLPCDCRHNQRTSCNISSDGNLSEPRETTHYNLAVVGYCLLQYGGKLVTEKFEEFVRNLNWMSPPHPSEKKITTHITTEGGERGREREEGERGEGERGERERREREERERGGRERDARAHAHTQEMHTHIVLLCAASGIESIAPRRNRRSTSPSPLPGMMRSRPPDFPFWESCECRQRWDLLASQNSSRLLEFPIRLAMT